MRDLLHRIGLAIAYIATHLFGNTHNKYQITYLVISYKQLYGVTLN